MSRLTVLLVILLAGRAAADDGAVPAWRPRLDGVTLPRHPARGVIGGQPFRVDRVWFQTNLVLQELEGQAVVRQLMITRANVLGGRAIPLWRRLAVEQELAGALHRPQIAFLGVPAAQPTFDRYSLRVELDAPRADGIPGRLYVCVQDAMRSVVAGSFVLRPGRPGMHADVPVLWRVGVALRAEGARPTGLAWHWNRTPGPGGRGEGIVRYRDRGRRHFRRVQLVPRGRTWRVVLAPAERR